MVIDWLKVETFKEHLVRRQARQKHINGSSYFSPRPIFYFMARILVLKLI